MSKIGTELLSHLSDDMGEPDPRYKDVFNDMLGGDPIQELDDIMLDAGMTPKTEEAMEEWELSKYSTEQLQAELARRGYVNGVLVHPELDQ